MNSSSYSRQEIQFLPYESIVQINSIHHKECLVCANTHQQLTIFDQCGHSFCQRCLSQHLSYALKRYNIPKCPEDGCQTKLSYNSNAFELLDEQQRQSYKKIVSYHQIIKNPNYLPCQKQICTGIIDKTLNHLICNHCGEEHCSSCYQLLHDGECSAKIAIQLQSLQKFRQCLNCGQIIQKSQGCTHMQCTCGHYFCYGCGQTLGASEHYCVPPSELNCLEKVRWSIEHQQLWYQFNSINFLKYLLFVSPSRATNPIIKVLWSFIYFILLYPLSMVLAILLILLTVVTILVLFLGFTFFIPFLGLCSDHLQLWPTTIICEQCGVLLAAVSVILLYPVLYFINLFQFLAYAQNQDDQVGEILYYIASHLFKGIRNMSLIPCLMLTDNQDYYLGLGKLRQFKIQRQQAKIDI